ncbi:MAG: RNA polymerase sigma factor [Pseudonocardiaceae bacterium]
MSAGRGGEWDLVQAAQRGERDAFGQLYARYAPEVFRFAVPRTGDRWLAQDVTSETFARALRRIESVSYQGRDVGAWFTTIARNLITDHWKSSRTKRDRPLAQPPETTDRGAGPERAVLTRETREELRAAIAALPTAEQRECIRLRYLEDLSIAETAVVMGRGHASVKALTHRALVGLRTTLGTGTGPGTGARVVGDPLAATRRAVAAAHHQVATTAYQATTGGRATHVPHPRARDEALCAGERQSPVLAQGGAA